ncbi:GGDEF domain-containing protein [Noviherbaspirillum aridicola]|uniref:diguanylate cyclase n=1 Tax=Noviherbaspirillum aridicola TaxID=2849687 RepID=A0ABQ4Q404_9BURK|nr:diguanylate cyclase [Noviherbaspirillum aridicola]GIZ51782.1 GGDEF domain-containing protein [Noviherbaspirillum aridicola]
MPADTQANSQSDPPGGPARPVGGDGFPPELEHLYQLESERSRERRYVKTGLVGVGLYASFAISDMNMVPDIYLKAWAVRFLLVIPLMLACTLFLVRLRRLVAREVLVAVCVILSGASLAWIATLSRHPNSEHYISGVMLIILFGNIVMNQRFRSALITSLILLGVYGALIAQAETLPLAARFNNVLFCLSTAVISLIACHRMDQDQRRAFLARMRETERNDQLSRANALLEKLSSEDGLTGLANRRAFDQRLEAEWARARRAGEPLSLLMMDIDFFKRYNDHYGHPAGDVCLQRVAAVLDAHARRPADLVARVGGEEFAVLLPSAGTAAAVQLAERMRLAVAAAEIPHAASGAAGHVTASFGVASVVPDGSRSPSSLVAAADAALYRAKELGRNQVVASREAVVA